MSVYSSSSIFDEIMQDVVDECYRIADEFRDLVKERLSVPVETVTGPRGGVKKIRSLPGEHPRMDSGELRESVMSNVIVGEYEIEAEVFTDIYYAGILQDNLDRPIMNEEELEDFLADRLADAFGGSI